MHDGGPAGGRRGRDRDRGRDRGEGAPGRSSGTGRRARRPRPRGRGAFRRSDFSRRVRSLKARDVQRWGSSDNVRRCPGHHVRGSVRAAEAPPPPRRATVAPPRRAAPRHAAPRRAGIPPSSRCWVLSTQTRKPATGGLFLSLRSLRASVSRGSGLPQPLSSSSASFPSRTRTMLPRTNLVGDRAREVRRPVLSVLREYYSPYSRSSRSSPYSPSSR